VEFRILGPLDVIHEGRSLPLRGSRERAVLAVLLSDANRVVSVDRIAEELWSGSPPEGAVPAVRVFVSRLRKSLRAASADVIVTEAAGYVARVAPELLDSTRFETLVAQGREHTRRGDHVGAARALTEALALWRGPALAEVAEGPFVRAEAARLDEIRATALEERLDADLACGRHLEVVAELEALTRSHPLRERLWAQRMVALYRSGRQAEALRAYQDIRQILARELGLEPSPALARLEGAILRQEPNLDLPPAPDGRGPAAVVKSSVVTVLFSDIESSTRRWEGDPVAMARDLALHDELLRSAFEQASGEVFSHTGDGLCVAFAGPAAAFDAAIAGQHAMRRAPWSGSDPLRVRMAIHTGAVERRAGNYFGPPLNRAARLLALAWGGQVLCSQVAAEAVGGDLPPTTALVDLGEHRLADLARPERVFQVNHPELPAAFPPLRSPGTMRHNLPVAISRFVGRAAELEYLRDTLPRARLVTLTGVGGAGKTRLAIEAGAAAREDFPDGVWFVDLAPVRDESLLASVIADTLELAGSGLEGPDRILEHVCACLGGKRTLLILDNCEHLIWAAARATHTLLAACQEVTVMATSREALGLPGEIPWRVPPLSLPPADPATVAELAGSDAVWLFLERARTARPSFEMNPENARAVARICRRLDGIPLALELAAARVRALSVEQVAARLDDCFRLLGGGTRTAVARHQTLRATLDWSYGLLDPEEQAVLRQLAVFPASFDLDAAEAVAVTSNGDPLDGVSLISRLVDKSLVMVLEDGDDIRYRLLESIRQYGAEKLAAMGEAASAEQRHHRHFLEVVGRWEAGLTTLISWPLRLVALEQENLRAALEWAWREGDLDAALRLIAAQSQFWLWGGHFEGCDWSDRVVKEAKKRGVPLPWLVLSSLGMLLQTFGRAGPDVCRELLEEAVAAATEEGDPAGVAFAQWVLGSFQLTLGNAAEARDLIERAAAEFERSGDVDGFGWCHHDLGWVAVADGDLDRARMHFERIIDLARQGRLWEWLTPHVLAGAAPVIALGEADRARRLAAEGVGHARLIPGRMILAMALARSAETDVVAGAPRHAMTTLRELLGLLRDLHARRWMADALELVATLAADEDGATQAAKFFGAAGALRDALGEPPGGIRVVAGAVHGGRERVEQALGAARFKELEQLGRTSAADSVIAEALLWLDPTPYG
jgi:predicted ATPase/DNA-binding SARP family transcriptional activator